MPPVTVHCVWVWCEMTYTVEQFRNLPRHCRGEVLTIEEFSQSTTPTAITLTEVGRDTEVMLYVTNHLFGHGALPEDPEKGFVPTTSSIPYSIVPRKGFEDGLVETHADYHRFQLHCYPKLRVIESLEELVDYLNEHYRENT